MSYKAAIKRFVKIIDFVERKNYPSRDEIISFLSEDENQISISTFKRDLNVIDVDFGLEIKYHPVKKGYFLDKENSESSDTFLRVIQLLHTSEILQETIKDNRENLKYLSFDNSASFQGINLLPKILESIKSNQTIQFSHYNFSQKTNKNYTLNPYGLKEYANRWYVIGEINGSQEIRTFGLDRIENLEIQAQKFQPNKNVHPLQEFENVVGLIYSKHKIQKVVLSFTPFQGNYLKTLAIHHSQKIIVDNEQELIIELLLKPNIELTQKILSFGDSVTVLEPSWLVEEVKLQLENTLKKYR